MVKIVILCVLPQFKQKRTESNFCHNEYLIPDLPYFCKQLEYWIKIYARKKVQTLDKKHRTVIPERKETNHLNPITSTFCLWVISTPHCRKTEPKESVMVLLNQRERLEFGEAEANRICIAECHKERSHAEAEL